jgi:hypothetical protein
MSKAPLFVKFDAFARVELPDSERLEGWACGIPHLPKPGRCGAPGTGDGDRVEKLARPRNVRRKRIKGSVFVKFDKI